MVYKDNGDRGFGMNARDFFNDVGNILVEKDRLHMCVIGTLNMSLLNLRIFVEIISKLTALSLYKLLNSVLISEQSVGKSTK